MELSLKSISKSGIAEAINKIHLYRFLNEPEEAESICRDILAIEPEHQLALRMLGLCITDQFDGSPRDRYTEAEHVFQSLANRYEKLYYTGLLYERRAKAQLNAGHPPHTLRILFEDALRCFEEAERIRPPENDDAILRWNRCVRLLLSHPELEWKHDFRAVDISDSPPF